MSQRAPSGRRVKRKSFFTAAVAALTMVLASLGLATATAAPNVPSGVYSGPIGQSTERTVTFPVSNGVIGEIEAQTYMYCGGIPAAMWWGDNPDIQIADDGTFSAEFWYLFDDNPDSNTRFRISGSISSDGVATGELRVHMPNMAAWGCAEGTEPFRATVETPVLDPQIQVAPTSITQHNLATDGVEVTGTDFPASSSVSFTIDGVNAGSVSANANGAFTGTASADLAPGSYTLTASSGSASASATLTVTPNPAEPSISVTPSSLTVSELADDGVEVSGSDFPANSDVTITIGGTAAGTATTNANGDFSTSASATVAPGTHTVTATSGSASATGSIVVTADPAEPSISVAPGSLTVSELAYDGVEVAGSDFPANSDVTITIGGTAAGTATTNANGAFSTTASATVAPGTHTVTATSGSASASGSVVVTADPLEPSISVTPGSLTVSELAYDGVEVAGSDFPANSDVTITIGNFAAGSATTNANGAFSVSASATVAPGTHTVTATSGSASSTGSVVVTADPATPVLAVQPDEVSEETLRIDGVIVSGSGFPAHSHVQISIGDTAVGSAPTDASGVFSQNFTAEVTPGTITVSAVSGSSSATAILTVTAEAWDPRLEVTPTELTQSELAEDGVTVAASGFRPGEVLSIALNGELWHEIEAGDNGTASVTLTRELEPGEHEITVNQSWMSGGGWLSALRALEASVTITVTEDAPPAPEPELELETTSVTVSELADGVELTGSGFTAAEALVVSFDGDDVATLLADAEGAFTTTVSLGGVEPGEYVIAVTGASGTATITITVVADEPTEPEPTEPELELENDTVTVSELAAGVGIAASGFAPDEELTIEFGGDVIATDTADEAGRIAGTISQSDAQPGEYVITVRGNSGAASATLTVTADETDPEPSEPEPSDPEPSDPEPSAPEPTDSNGGGTQDDELPDTGFDATLALLGLAVASLIGGAVLAMSVRRRNEG